MCGLQVAVSGGYCLLQCTGFSLQRLLLLQSMGPRDRGFSKLWWAGSSCSLVCVKSSWTKYRTCVAALAGGFYILYHQKPVLILILVLDHSLEISFFWYYKNIFQIFLPLLLILLEIFFWHTKRFQIFFLLLWPPSLDIFVSSISWIQSHRDVIKPQKGVLVSKGKGMKNLMGNLLIHSRTTKAQIPSGDVYITSPGKTPACWDAGLRAMERHMKEQKWKLTHIINTGSSPLPSLYPVSLDFPVQQWIYC